MTMIQRVAQAMRNSKAWPAVFGAGAAEELARVAVEAMPQWQPIETAPKDGTKIDVWAVTTYTDGHQSEGERHTDVGWRLPDSWSGTLQSKTWCELNRCDSSLGFDCIEVEAKNRTTVITHWVPLPEPPESA